MAYKYYKKKCHACWRVVKFGSELSQRYCRLCGKISCKKHGHSHICNPCFESAGEELKAKLNAEYKIERKNDLIFYIGIVVFAVALGTVGYFMYATAVPPDEYNTDLGLMGGVPLAIAAIIFFCYYSNRYKRSSTRIIAIIDGTPNT